MSVRFVAAVLIAAGVATVAQSPAPTIRIRVVAADGGRPIPNARVVFARPDSDNLGGGTTGGTGTLTLNKVSPGRYRLVAVATGFLTGGFSDEPNLGETLIAVPTDAQLPEITIALHRGSTIAGVVTNDLKEPVIGADVSALSRRSRSGDYRYYPMGANTAKTDDRGAYRLIGLEPGEYLVRAVDGLSVAYASAAPIAVGVDTEHTGVHIQTKPGPSGTITGSVTGPGAGLPGIQIKLFPDPDPVELIPVTTARTDASGRFSIDDVPIGKYVLVVQPGLAQNQPQVWGRTIATVTAAGTAPVAIVLRGSARISGRVSGQPPRRGEIQVVPVGLGHPEASPARGVVGTDGAFVIPAVAPGRYQWRANQQLGGSGRFVLSVFVKDTDVSDAPFEVAPASVIENVKITLTEPAHVIGTVRDAAGKLTTEGAVIVASTDPRDWSSFSRRIQIARPDTAGMYDASGLPAGRYTVSLVTRLKPGQLWDPAFLKTLAKSPQVTPTEGQTAVVDLRLK
jgi:hypothetical protein